MGEVEAFEALRGDRQRRDHQVEPAARQRLELRAERTVDERRPADQPLSAQLALDACPEVEGQAAPAADRVGNDEGRRRADSDRDVNRGILR